MKYHSRTAVKTTVILDQSLIEEIDRINPFPTRKEFLARASKEYLEKLKRKAVDERLATACAEAADEDRQVNLEWEGVTLETWL